MRLQIPSAQAQARPGISQKIRRYDKEPYIPVNLKQAMKRSKKIVWKVRYAMYKQRLWTNSQTTGGSWNRSCPKETTDITIIPIIINPKRIERAFRLSFTKTINPKTTRIISVTTLSIFAKSQGEYSETSMIFTKKSSFISRNTTMAILATKQHHEERHKILEQLPTLFPIQCRTLRFHRNIFFGRLRQTVQAYPSNANRGNATAPINAGIQNSFTCRLFITYNPADLAVPELITILTPNRLARISVIRRPSIKLKITPTCNPTTGRSGT